MASNFRYIFLSDIPREWILRAYQILAFRSGNKRQSSYRGIDQFLDDFIQQNPLPANTRPRDTQPPSAWLTAGIGGKGGIIDQWVGAIHEYVDRMEAPLLEKPTSDTELGTLEGRSARGSEVPQSLPGSFDSPQIERNRSSPSDDATAGPSMQKGKQASVSAGDQSRESNNPPSAEAAPAPANVPFDMNQMGAVFGQFMQFLQSANSTMQEQRTAGSPSVSEPGDRRGFRIQEIGFFQPNLPASFGKGDVVYSGSDTFIRDVFVFIDRIRDAIASRSEEIVKPNIPACLRGDALEWYTSGLTMAEKDALRYVPGMARWEDLLVKEFRPPFQDVMNSLTRASFTLEDAKHRKQAGPYVYSIIRNAKAAGMMDTPTHLDWAYNNIHPLLQDGLLRPTEGTEVTAFIRSMNDKRETWHNLAQLYLDHGIGKRGDSGKYSSSADSRQTNRPSGGYRSNRDAGRSRQSGYTSKPTYNNQQNANANSKLPPPSKPRPSSTSGGQSYQRDRQSSDRGKSSNFKQGKPMKAFQSNNAETEELDEHEQIVYEQGYAAALANMGLEEEVEDDDCDPATESENEEPAQDDTVDAHFVRVESKPSERSCRRCKQAFASGNQLHRHIQNDCPKKGKATVRPSVVKGEIIEPTILHSSIKPTGTGLDFREWTYCTCQAAAKPNGQSITICADTGSTMTLVDPSFLKAHFKDAPIKQMPSKVNVSGVANASARAPEFTILDLYIPGTYEKEGRTIKGLAHLQVEAHIVETKAGLLLGVDYIGPNRIIVDAGTGSIRIGACRNLKAPAVFRKKPATGIRAVKAKEQTTIPANTVHPISIAVPESANLPRDRDYLFEPSGSVPKLGSGGGVYAHIVDADVETVYVYNASISDYTIHASTVLGEMKELILNGSKQINEEFHVASCDHAPLWQTNNSSLLRTASYDLPSGQLLREPKIIPMDDDPILVHTAHPEDDDQPLTQTGDREWLGSFGVHIYGDHATAEQLDALVRTFEPLFTDDGKIANIDEDDWMRIPLTSDWKASGVKLAHRVYPLGPKERELVDQVHNRLHEQGKMQYSKGGTPFAFPVFVVWREVMINGELARKGRVVTDIRGLNKIARRDSYPIPSQEAMLNRVRGCLFLSVFDMLAYFFQFRIVPEDQHKTTVISHRGLEEYLVAPMGYCGSPPYAQRQTDKLIRESSCQDFASGYMDDVLCHSQTLAFHLSHLDQLLSAFMAKQMTIAGSKTYLGYPSVTLLGQRVDAFGMYTSDEKIAAIRNLSFPKTLADLELYIGLTGWLRQYVAYYSQLIEPLNRKKTELLKAAPKAGYARTHYAKTTEVPQNEDDLWISYQAIQDAFKEPRWLAHFDPARQLYIGLDASKHGFGVVVFHAKGDPTNPEDIKRSNIEPIQFISKVLSTAERSYWPTELEVACLVHTIKRTRHMVDSAPLDKPPIVLTDHAATTGIAKQTSLTSSSVDKLNLRLVRASQYLSQYRLDIRHVPGRTHIVPDALSRLSNLRCNEADLTTNVLDDLSAFQTEEDLSTYKMTMLELDDDFKNHLKEAYRQDKHWASVLEILEPYGQHPDPQELPIPFLQQDQLLYYIEPIDHSLRLVIPKSLQGDIFEMMHDQRMHTGFNRTYEAIRTTYHIRKLAKHLDEYIRHCRKCGPNQTRRHKPHGDLRPIQTPPMPFHTITIDLVTGIPEDQSCDAVMSVTCKFSKRITLIPGRTNWDAAKWAKALLDALADWGIPSAIISDRDTKFVSQLWKAIFTQLGTKILMSTAYHPETDGQSERTNQTFEIALRFLLAEGAEGWVQVLPSIRRIMNNSPNASTGLSPNEVIYGFKVSEGNVVDQPFCDVLLEREVNRKEAQNALAAAAVQMKRQYDAKHQPLRLQSGDQAYVRLHKGFQVAGVHRKLGQQYAGPFLVKRPVGNNAYELDLPVEWKIHPVISINYLEKYYPDDPYGRKEPEQPGAVEDERNTETEAYYKVEKLLDRRTRMVGRSRKPVIQYLVKWLGWPAEYNQWISSDGIDPELTAQFDQSLPARGDGVIAESSNSRKRSNARLAVNPVDTVRANKSPVPLPARGPRQATPDQANGQRPDQPSIPRKRGRPRKEHKDPQSSSPEQPAAPESTQRARRSARLAENA